MSVIQIYYLIPSQLNRNLGQMNINLNQILQTGNKTIQEVRNEIKTEPQFCRDEYGIDFNHLHSSVGSDISLYAILDGKIAGLLTFMFLARDSERYILLNGICSPQKYSGLGIGQELINTLIRISKSFNVKYIKLDCKGEGLMNYYKQFGFTVSKRYTADDSDDSDDSDDEGSIHYTMILELSRISGGKKKKVRTLKRKTRRAKRKNTRRKLRKYH
jgi:hypothetical protein